MFITLVETHFVSVHRYGKFLRDWNSSSEPGTIMKVWILGNTKLPSAAEKHLVSDLKAPLLSWPQG